MRTSTVTLTFSWKNYNRTKVVRCVDKTDEIIHEKDAIRDIITVYVVEISFSAMEDIFAFLSTN